MGKVPLLVAALSIILLACQPWYSEAYNNQRTSWMNEHAQRKGRMDISTTVDAKRRLSEEVTAPVQKGWRAELVNTNHRLHSIQNLSSMQRIEHNVQTSLARGHALDMKARRAIHSTEPGRKALESDSYLSTVVNTRGSYSMSFSLGTPPQNFLAVADTGSDLVWLQCAACTTCFDQPSALFDPTASLTYAPVGCTTGCSILGNHAQQCSSTCKYQYAYGDLSRTSGDFSTDVFTLNNTGNTTTGFPSFQFGCGLNNTGTFQNTDGIVGLARGPISLPSQIASYLNDTNRFSYCLDHRYDADTSSPIVFGSAAQPNNLSAIAYTPILIPSNSLSFYYVNLTSISVDGEDAGIPASAFAISDIGYGGTIFDSGTTYTILVPDAYTPVVNLFASKLAGVYLRVDLSAQTGLDLCYDVSGETSVRFPGFEFLFQDAAFDLLAENIFVYFRDGVGTYMCLALLQGSPAIQLNIFGNTQQQNFQVIYDIDQNQIGWEHVDDCSTV